MNEDEFARALLAHERKEWQDPEKILSQLKLETGMVAADLACGPGYFTIPLARAVGTGGRVYAVDSSKVMLDYLASNMKRSKNIGRTTINVVKSDITETRIASSSVDIVLLADILHDAPNQARLFSEIRRISKQDSKLVVIDWKKKETGVGPAVAIRLAENESKKILRDNDYGVNQTIDAGPFHYGLVCKQVFL
ncbi:MAG: class I SAM-dependent methyltransferase [Nitrososphaerales archaeon]